MSRSTFHGKTHRELVIPKYQPLYDHLVKKREEGYIRWQTSFTELESIIGAHLPPSARIWRIFWSNLRQPRRASTAWFLAGWKTSKVDMKEEALAFLAEEHPPELSTVAWR